MAATDSLSGLFKTGGIMAILIVAIIPVQLFIFIAWPPPESVAEFFALFQQNWLLGLLSLDLLYLFNNVFLIFVYLALYAALKRVNHSAMLMALISGIVGIAIYYASAVAFEMMSLSQQFAMAETTEMKQQLMSAGQTLLVTYKGTAFDIYYVLNAVALLIISFVMLKDTTFSKTTGVFGLVSGVLMIIPSTAGTLGLIFSIASLIPWIIFSILVSRRLFQLSNKTVEK